MALVDTGGSLVARLRESALAAIARTEACGNLVARPRESALVTRLQGLDTLPHRLRRRARTGQDFLGKFARLLAQVCDPEVHKGGTLGVLLTCTRWVETTNRVGYPAHREVW